MLVNKCICIHKKNIYIYYKNMAKCYGWCYPAVIYAILAIISLAMTLLQDFSHLGENENKFRISIFVFHTLMALFWTWVLYWLCSNCHNVAAWIVLFLPVFIGIVTLVLGTVALSAFMVGRVAEEGVGKVKQSVENYDDYDDDYM